MFERFTDRSRRVLILAQEEARQLHHDFIGTEHILLGLIHEEDGVAAHVLGSLGITLEAVRESVDAEVDTSRPTPSGAPPFTPRAKKVLELSLHESLQRGTSYIGTEHLLLGLAHEGDGVAARVLVSLGVALSEIRQRTLWAMSGRRLEDFDQPTHQYAATRGLIGVASSPTADADWTWTTESIAIVSRLDAIFDRLDRIERRLGIESDEPPSQ